MNGKREERVKLNDTEAALRKRDQGLLNDWFRDVYQDIERVVWSVCLSRGFKNRVDIEDFIGEAMVDLAKAMPNFRGECTPATLTWRIADANCNDWMRKKYSQKRASTDGGDNEGSESEPSTDWLNKARLSVPENYMCAKRTLEEFASKYPGWYEIWSDDVYAGLSAEEMCAKYERAAGAMRMQIHRIRETLKALCKQHCGTESCQMA